MNERLIHFLGEMASLMMTLQQLDLADRMQMENIVNKRESTMAKIAELLNESRELSRLYNDSPERFEDPNERFD